MGRVTIRRFSVAARSLALAIAVGAVCGLGLYTFVYARGASYLTDNAAACVNCHVMRAQYDGWMKSSHRHVAVCNDCHTPDGLVPKYASKAWNGFLHAAAFTSGQFQDEIRIKPHMLAITERTCVKCHADIVHALNVDRGPRQQLACITCHQRVGHQ